MGLAAAKLGAEFSMGDLSFYAEVKSDVRAEAILRTRLDFLAADVTAKSLQRRVRVSRDASVEDVKNVTQETKRDWLATFHLNEQVWQQVADGYQPGCDAALYKFVCRHCGLVRFGHDCP